MKTFEYRGYEHSGRAARGLIEALDPKEAREKLCALGILPEQLTPAGARPTPARPFLRTAFDAEARAMFYREAGALLKAGLPLAQALDVVINAPEMGAHRPALAGVRDRLREGSSFASALARVGDRITPYEQAAIEVGERAGNLDAVLERLAQFMEDQLRVADRVRTALFYPCIVLAVAVVVVLVMLGVLVPSIGRMLAETRLPLPWLTRAMMFAGRWLLPLLAPLLLAAVAGGWWLRNRLRQDPELRARWNRRWFDFPIIGKSYTALVGLRFARTLSLLLRGGVQLVEGIALAGRATGSAWVAARAVAAAEEVRQGRSLAEAVRDIYPLAGTLAGWIQAGEASGRLEELLDSAAARCQHYWDRWITRALTLLEPLLILGVGLFVLLISLSILLPILQLNQTLR